MVETSSAYTHGMLAALRVKTRYLGGCGTTPEGEGSVQMLFGRFLSSRLTRSQLTMVASDVRRLTTRMCTEIDDANGLLNNSVIKKGTLHSDTPLRF